MVLLYHLILKNRKALNMFHFLNLMEKIEFFHDIQIF